MERRNGEEQDADETTKKVTKGMDCVDRWNPPFRTFRSGDRAHAISMKSELVHALALSLHIIFHKKMQKTREVAAS